MDKNKKTENNENLTNSPNNDSLNTIGFTFSESVCHADFEKGCIDTPDED